MVSLSSLCFLRQSLSLALELTDEQTGCHGPGSSRPHHLPTRANTHVLPCPACYVAPVDLNSGLHTCRVSAL